MSPRRNRPKRDDVPVDESRVGARQTTELWDGEPWTVRRIRGSSQKSYRCPGCDQLVPLGTAHIVAWPEQVLSGSGSEERRHWHTACWSARDRRRPGARR